MAGRSGSAGSVGVTPLGWAALPPMAAMPSPLLSDKAPLVSVDKSPRFGETMLSSKEVAASSLERMLVGQLRRRGGLTYIPLNERREVVAVQSGHDARSCIG